jgi:response regulator RpfG family c-di-GMP phosphodiesterase
MARSGPIVLIDDDHDDKDVFEHVIKDIGIPNELIYFDNCPAALHYLQNTARQPFIIFCDINLPKLNGIDFKQIIDNDLLLRKKSIPFVFYSTSVDQRTVNKAYIEMTIQGFFQKGTAIEQIKQDVKRILEYWLLCRHPNSTY